MIFHQALRRELSFTTGGVFLVLVTIMITTLVIRILGFAANGAVNPEDALVLIALATLGYMAVLLTVSLFVAVLIVLVRWYKDSEMIVWFASGLSITNLIRPILQFATPLIIVIALLALFVWPWANRESTLISQRFQQRAAFDRELHLPIPFAGCHKRQPIIPAKGRFQVFSRHCKALPQRSRVQAARCGHLAPLPSKAHAVSVRRWPSPRVPPYAPPAARCPSRSAPCSRYCLPR